MPKYYEYKVCGYYLYYTSHCIIEAMHVHASDKKLTESGSAKFFVKSNQIKGKKGILEEKAQAIEKVLTTIVNRNKKEIDFDKHHLINSKYKVIITHKPIKKVYIRTPMLILWSNCNKLFKECLKEYNFNTLFELINTYSLDILAKNINKEQVIPILKKFINEYINYSFNSLIINHVLKYINDESFSNEILDQIKTH